MLTNRFLDFQGGNLVLFMLNTQYPNGPSGNGPHR